VPCCTDPTPLQRIKQESVSLRPAGCGVSPAPGRARNRWTSHRFETASAPFRAGRRVAEPFVPKRPTRTVARRMLVRGRKTAGYGVRVIFRATKGPNARAPAPSDIHAPQAVAAIHPPREEDSTFAHRPGLAATFAGFAIQRPGTGTGGWRGMYPSAVAEHWLSAALRSSGDRPLSRCPPNASRTDRWVRPLD